MKTKKPDWADKSARSIPIITHDAIARVLRSAYRKGFKAGRKEGFAAGYAEAHEHQMKARISDKLCNEKDLTWRPSAANKPIS